MLFPVLSGFLLSASFAPISFWWSAPIAIALLLKSLENPLLTRRMLSLYLFALSFFAPLLHWSSTYVGAVPWAILTIFESLFLLPLAVIWPLRSWRIFLFPSLWLAIESLRSRFPFGGFGWGRLAFGQPDAPFSSLAGIGGAPLLSFFVALLGIFIYLVFTRQWSKSFFAGVIVLGLLSSLFLLPNPQQIPTFSVLAVQGGVPQLGLKFNARATAVFHKHLLVTEKYMKSAKALPDLIVWPENSVDVDPFRDLQVKAELQGVVNKYGIPILIGAVLDKGNYFENASILWEPNVGPTSRYIKRHLTPFGEYMPLRTIAEFISPYAKEVTGFRPGSAIVTHQVKDARIAPIICYELLDDQLGREMSKRSNVLVVQTNSATFGLSAESDQQLAITRIRAIEHQREIVSVATSGISAFVDIHGKVLQRSKQNRSQAMAQVVSLNSGISISDALGVKMEISLTFLPALLWIIISFLRRRRFS
jgi:apolipoprotein N-acyltransferase